MAAKLRAVEKTLSDFATGGCLIDEMQEKSDVQLLREYTAHANEAAFREIVVRHTDLVYSSALRQVDSPDLACDLAQSVFADLARKAPALAKSLDENASILGWLFRSTRFLALNQLRDDRRRQARERQAMEHFDPAPETAPEWDRIRPVLDEAIAELDEDDRDAVLLRFFKNRDFRAIGQSLGVSDDAAQKRVARALDKLRELLTRRGITTSAAALSVVLTANAVQAAPVGLAVTISTATALGGTTVAGTTTATAIKTIAMTTLQKTIIGATLAVVVGTGVYVAIQPSHPRSEQGTQMRADIDKDIPLARAIEQANAKFPDAQPLTEAEVVAAVRAIKMKHKDIPDPVFQVYQRVIQERVLPRGMYFSHIPGWDTDYGNFKVDWKDLTLDWDRAGIKEPRVGSSFNYRIRARFISVAGADTSTASKASRLVSEVTKAEYKAGTDIRADLDKDIPLAQAVEQANARFPDVQPLTEDEVVAAVRAIKLNHQDIPDSVYKVYQRVVQERVLPKGMYFSRIPGWNTENGNFEVDWKDLELDCDRAGIKDGEAGTSFNYRIRARFISSRPPTNWDRQAMRLNQERRAVPRKKVGQTAQ